MDPVTTALLILLIPLGGFILQIFFGWWLPRQGDWLPTLAMGSTSIPVMRPVAGSQVGRHPISARPCAISSPPVRRVALPQRSITVARGISP